MYVVVVMDCLVHHKDTVTEWDITLQWAPNYISVSQVGVKHNITSDVARTQFPITHSLIHLRSHPLNH